MSLSFLAGSNSFRTSAARAAAAVVCAAALSACSPTGEESCNVTVSNPAMGYFVSRLAPAGVVVNVMIPQGADHDSYTPRPGQMASLAESSAYMAFGPLEFELTWRERIMAASPKLKWCDVSEGIQLIASDHHHGHECQSADPHYWLSPRQAAKMSRNIAAALKDIYPGQGEAIDSSLVRLLSDVGRADSAVSKVAQAKPGEAFVIYHPALAYLARDYGFRQLCVGGDGMSPSPRRFAALADSARLLGARVFFLQAGFAPDRVEATAAEMGARVVRIQPESDDWFGTMNVITSALNE